jgi:hypothetical protein
VHRTGRTDPVDGLLDLLEGFLGRRHIAIMNGLEDVLGVRLDDSLAPAIAGTAVFILADLLLASGGVWQLRVSSTTDRAHRGTVSESGSIAEGRAFVNQITRPSRR